MKKKISLVSFNLENLKDKMSNKIKFNNDLRLIGNWCRNEKILGDSSKSFYSLNFNVWKNHRAKSKDIEKINIIYKSLLTELVKNLNILHQKQYQKKYWEFLLNRWLMATIVEVFSKWQIAEKVLKNYRIENFYNLKVNDDLFIPENTMHHNELQKRNGVWPHIIFKKIFNFKLNNLNQVNVDYKRNILKKKIYRKMFQKYTIKSFFNLFLSKKIFSYEIFFNKYILINLFLKNFFLNLKFKQNKINLKSNQKNLREKFENLFFISKKNNIENFIKRNIRFFFPKIFLENFSLLENCYSKLNWPKNPDYILTTYGHYYDEIFKIYCSKNIVNDTKIFIFQHGDGAIYADNDYYNLGWDKILCDKYFVWGKNPKKKYNNFYFTKKFFLITQKFKVNLSFQNLIIMYGFNEQQESVRPISGFNNSYETNKELILKNLNFYKNLKMNIKNKLNVKILDNSKNKTVTSSIKKIYKYNKIIGAKENYYKTLKNMNFVVHFYLGTPFFESMFFNKPTFLIFDEKFHLNHDKEFIFFLDQFEKNKIIFKNPKNAANFINNNFDNLESWWNNRIIQKLRNNFCENYCRNFDNSKDFKNLFKK